MTKPWVAAKRIRYINRSPDINPPASTPAAVLQVKGLCFDYPGQPLFSDFSTLVPPGVTLLRGGAGRGKTTLLRLLAGVLPPGAGQMHINGVSLQAQPQAYRQQVFWAEPRSDAFDQLKALAYFAAVRDRHVGFDDALLALVIAGLSLAEHVGKPLFMLSSGSKRKVWLAAAFASRAAVTLLDEPFAALDKKSIGFVLELLQDAADHPERAWVLAHHEAPGEVRLAAVIDLGD